MNDQNPENFITNYQDALDTTPQEVRDFLWSDGYKGIIAGIAKTLNLTPAQTKVVEDVMFDISISAIDEAGSRERLSAVGITPEIQDTVFALGYEYIVAPSITEAENTKALEEEYGPIDNADNGSSENDSSGSQTPNDVLTSLGSRLTQPSVLAPTKRDYSVTNIGDVVPMKPIAPKTFDPYRELPEK